MAKLHGKAGTPEYHSWQHMIQRCTNKNNERYKDYGGRGIEICKEWKESFMDFFNYIGKKPTPGHSIDRIDNNKGYEPGNVKWSTPKEQANNRDYRNSYKSRKIVFDGFEMGIPEWCEILNLSCSAMYKRLDQGKPIEEVLFLPADKRFITRRKDLTDVVPANQTAASQTPAGQ